MPFERRRSDGLDAVAAQISHDLDLELARLAGKSPTMRATCTADIEAIVPIEISRSPRRATSRQIDRRSTDNPLHLAEPPLDQAGFLR